MIALEHSWHDILYTEINKEYFKKLIADVDTAYQLNECYPPKNQIFRAFNSCPFHDIKVVIIGQDPYHGAGEANGLCFSVNDGIKIPPSLKNIFRELANDYHSILFPTSGNLEPWAKQGVLLLNATLTVQKDKPNSHKKIKWQTFTDQVINLISEQKKDIVFLLWGSFAQKKSILIDHSKHFVLSAGHPSPLSANKGRWFGHKHFSKTNEFLNAKNIPTIQWHL
ncbi:uracil-DNA glycosylase [Flavobacterium branchiophilum]|uniref:Uracil-DNA glycosylase n=1 Tax=Flavobacterium branchiophilum (strain FL-15) TaxID=1034807 RepID=G2Z1A0_FLABF|nr:uracil-DNA glycosylase [Flavobacterium branchiophilum]CCB69663.1 Uracil-DNA glycosylase [Flavobacterium branchiophilum FL-15]